MSGTNSISSAHVPTQDEDRELAQLGIVRVPSSTFEWNGYRYTHARDAIAAARRESAK